MQEFKALNGNVLSLWLTNAEFVRFCEALDSEVLPSAFSAGAVRSQERRIRDCDERSAGFVVDLRLIANEFAQYDGLRQRHESYLFALESLESARVAVATPHAAALAGSQPAPVSVPDCPVCGSVRIDSAPCACEAPDLLAELTEADGAIGPLSEETIRVALDFAGFDAGKYGAESSSDVPLSLSQALDLIGMPFAALGAESSSDTPPVRPSWHSPEAHGADRLSDFVAEGGTIPSDHSEDETEEAGADPFASVPALRPSGFPNR